jgi:hypothetical protein
MLRRPCEDGNYNAQLQKCVCPIGRNGTRCERDALPACRSTPSSAASCIVDRPQHCACAAQCVANGAFAAHLYRYCFITALRYTSDVPADEHEAAFFDRASDQAVSRDKALTVYRDELATVALPQGPQRHVPLSRCSHRCHERGACVASPALGSPARCRCGLQRRSNMGPCIRCRCSANVPYSILCSSRPILWRQALRAAYIGLVLARLLGPRDVCRRLLPLRVTLLWTGLRIRQWAPFR